MFVANTIVRPGAFTRQLMGIQNQWPLHDISWAFKTQMAKLINFAKMEKIHQIEITMESAEIHKNNVFRVRLK